MTEPGQATLGDPAAIARLEAAVGRIAELTRGRAATGGSHADADDTVGTIGTDDAIGFDPFPLLRALHRSGVRVAVIGQVAGIMHGSVELTGDLDLLWDGDPVHAAALASAFAQVEGGPAVLQDNDGVPVACEAASFLGTKVLFSTATASGDCCTAALPWGGAPVADYLARSLRAVAEDGLEVHYLRIDDLAQMRRAVGRPKDHRRADELDRLAAAARHKTGATIE
ncbi:hypothetical protein ACFV9C_17810 [Kribbella sp. NPDC059898]|uniref:hypothetical protein n=1 Tax=Kribbella sp. NPDC059898 TaxID=3346995 RepID=UPI003646D0F5